MLLTCLRLTLLAAAALALALPAAAQDTPIIVDPAPSLREVVPPVATPPAAPSIVIRPEEAAPVDPIPAVAPVEPIVVTVEPATPSIPAIWAPAPTDEYGRSAYGLYLSGRVAAFRGDRAASSDFLTLSQQLTPEQPVVADEAFRSAMIAGDLESAARLAPGVAEDAQIAGVGRLSVAINALREGEGEVALAELERLSFSSPYDRVARYVTPAVAAAAGDWDKALAPVPEEALVPATLWILRDQRARLLESRRRYDEAEAEYKALLEQPAARRLFGIHYGAFLERRGRRDEALAAYAAAIQGPAPDARVLSELNRLNARGRPPAVQSPAEIASDALAFAALEASELEVHELAAIYLQLSVALHPDDATLLRLGQTLGRINQNQLARETFARVSPANPIQYAAAQLGSAETLAEEERHDEALEALARADLAAPQQPEVARRYAAGFLALDRYQDALDVLNRPAVAAAAGSVDFRFLRGFTLSRLGRLDEAEAELWAALQEAPDNPVLLNQLGYMWVDTGRRVDQGAEMLARAHAADPENGNIQDSLGWAQYRQGQYEVAVATLEEAVAKQPGNAEIVDHLGDAYWQVGRKREAGWQWSRVLTLGPDAERRASVEAKIASGLTPVQPVSVTVAGEP